MVKSTLDVAQTLISKRNFTQAIKMLESRQEIYEESFDYYFTLGNAYLYLGDIGRALSNFEYARKLRINDTNLLIAFAAIFLRRGDTDRAIQYYLDVLDNDPQNTIAKNALEFIRKNSDYEVICKWVDCGKIEQFYPSINAKNYSLLFVSCAVILGLLFGVLIVNLCYKKILIIQIELI